MLLDQLVADITAPIIHGDLASGSASFALQWIIKIPWYDHQTVIRHK